MRIAIGLLGLLAMAGCANPYAMPPPTRLMVLPAVPRYEPPPVVFQPSRPSPDLTLAPKVPDPEPAAVTEPPPTATVEPPAPAAVAAPAAPTPAPVAVEKAKAPDSGGAVPMMGFRPMKGQKAPGA